MKLKKLTAIIVAAPFVLSCPAQANMQNAMNSMFMANVTTPGIYQSASRSGFVGGGFSLHTPIKPINLAAFDPPRLSMGCGGIDMYGGSFSFINVAQFTQLLRNIMNNALGLLFQAALTQIDPGIANLLNQFSKMISDLNALASNTCAIANQVIHGQNPVAEESELAKQAGRVGEAAGTVMDNFSGMFTGSTTKTKDNNIATEVQNPAAGNATWRALNRSQAADKIGTIGMAIDPTDAVVNKQFIMSLIGTRILSDSALKLDPNAASGVPAATDPALPSGGKPWGPLFSLVTLLDFDSDTVPSVYTCVGNGVGEVDPAGPSSCVTMTQTAPLQMVSARDYVRNMLYGDSEQTTPSGIQNAISTNTAASPGVNSIYGRILKCQTGGCNMSAAEQNFLQLAGPIYNLLKQAQYDPSSINTFSQYLEDPLTVMVVLKLGEATVRAATTAWNGVDNVVMPENVNANIKELSRQMGILHAKQATYQDNLMKAKNISDTVRKSNPAFFNL